MYLGVEDGCKAHILFDPCHGEIVVSRDVVFEENEGWRWGPDGENQMEFATEDDTIVNPTTSPWASSRDTFSSDSTSEEDHEAMQSTPLHAETLSTSQLSMLDSGESLASPSSPDIPLGAAHLGGVSNLGSDTTEDGILDTSQVVATLVSPPSSYIQESTNDRPANFKLVADLLLETPTVEMNYESDDAVFLTETCEPSCYSEAAR